MIEWDDKYSVNVSIIDNEHKKLIHIINTAIVAKKHKKFLNILDQILEYANNHFTTEESYLRKFNYSEYQCHRNEHVVFIEKMIYYKNRLLNGDEVANEILEYLKQWLVKHIQETSKKFTNYFNKNGLK